VGLIAVAASWGEVRERAGAYYGLLLWSLAGVTGVFLALDLFLFFFLWELMLIPMYFLIALWGHEGRQRAAIKFFIYTQVGGLLMLVAILGLAFVHFRLTGAFSFDYFDLLHTRLAPSLAWALMLCLFFAFAVKLPMFPIHTWLPDAHTEAPTGGSVLLAGILLKTGGYGLLRLALPLFPATSAAFAPYAMALGVAGILYGGVLAFAQNDAKRLVAYSSVSHMGFVLLGIYAMGTLAFQGAVVQMVAHGLTVGMLFLLVGALQQRFGTRDMARLGGLWDELPRLSAAGLFFAIAALGLPGLGNFVGEFLTLLGAYRVNAAFASVAAAGLVISAAYSLIWVQRLFLGPRPGALPTAPDLTVVELIPAFAAAALLFAVGLYPQPLFDSTGPTFSALPTAAGAP
jgi:NADH-quinone oxidoreductase subunit M